MVKFTPLLLTGLVAYTQAINVHDLIDDAISQIYSREGNVETISLEPYLHTVTTKLHNGMDIVGSWGMGNPGMEPVEFTRTFRYENNGGFSLVCTDQGNFDNTPFAMLDPELRGKSFDGTWSFSVDAGAMSVEFSNNGYIDGHDYAMKESVSIGAMRTGRNGMGATVHAVGFYRYDAALEDVSINWIPKHSYNVNIELTTNKQCTKNPVIAGLTGCTASVTMTGTASHSIAVKASNTKFLIEVSSNNRKQHTVKILYNNHDLYVVKHKGRSGGFSDIISLPGPARFERIAQVSGEYIAPFRKYVEGMIRQPERAPHAIVWADRPIAELSTEFDCSEVIAATGFRCPPLANLIGASNMQSFLKQGCSVFNQSAVQALKDASGPLKTARDYVNALTDEDQGGQEFNAWYNSL